MSDALIDPGVLVGVLALVGTIVTAISLWKSNQLSNKTQAEKVESEAWTSLLAANRESLSRIHEDYQAEIASIIKRFENKLADVQADALAAKEHAAECDQALANLQDKVRSLEQTRRENDG